MLERGVKSCFFFLFSFCYWNVLVTEHEVAQHRQHWGLHHPDHPHLYLAVLKLAGGFQIVTLTATSPIRQTPGVLKGTVYCGEDASWTVWIAAHVLFSYLVKIFLLEVLTTFLNADLKEAASSQWPGVGMSRFVKIQLTDSSSNRHTRTSSYRYAAWSGDLTVFNDVGHLPRFSPHSTLTFFFETKFHSTWFTNAYINLLKKIQFATFFGMLNFQNKRLLTCWLYHRNTNVVF